MAGDPFGLLLRQRIVFFGGEVRRGSVPGLRAPSLPGSACSVQCSSVSRPPRAGCRPPPLDCGPQVNDFSADAIISQLLLLDAQDPTKVRWRRPRLGSSSSSSSSSLEGQLHKARRAPALQDKGRPGS